MNDGLFEIERKYLLRARPPIPEAAELWRIEQGYLDLDPQAGVHAYGSADELTDGRIRRTVLVDGTAIHTHTVKTGEGLVRREIEREITKEVFDRAWPRTRDRRLQKSRYRVPAGDLTWEIDVFTSIELVLAEVELPAPDTIAPIPAWLGPFIDREVTDEPAFTNAAIAFRLGLASLGREINNSAPPPRDAGPTSPGH